jgi:uncharacterized protein YybS (DUF2232 family)
MQVTSALILSGGAPNVVKKNTGRRFNKEKYTYNEISTIYFYGSSLFLLRFSQTLAIVKII